MVGTEHEGLFHDQRVRNRFGDERSPGSDSVTHMRTGRPSPNIIGRGATVHK